MKQVGDTQNAKEQATADLGACYARLFLGSDDGKRVLRDLLRKFPNNRARFDLNNPEPLKAALIDGQCTVTREIEDAIRLGATNAGLQYP